jgi:hypothetical protein
MNHQIILKQYLEERSKRLETLTMICVTLTNQLQLFREAKYACKPQDLIDSNIIALDLERNYNLVLALRTAKDTDLILDK